MNKRLISLIFLLSSFIAHSDDSALSKYKDYTPKELAALSKEERQSSVPMSYSSAARRGLSDGATLLFEMQMNSLMYPAIGNYEGAVRQFQRDLKEKETGVLTVSQIDKLQRNSGFQKLSRVYFPETYSSYMAKTVASVQGTFMIHDDRIANPVNHTKLTCYKEANYCELKQIYLNFPDLKSWGRNFHIMEGDIEIFDITQWSENTIDAVPSESSNSCRKTAFNLNFKTKEFYQITRNGDKECELNYIPSKDGRFFKD